MEGLAGNMPFILGMWGFDDFERSNIAAVEREQTCGD